MRFVWILIGLVAIAAAAGGIFAVLTGLVETALPPKQVPVDFQTVDGELRVTVPELVEVGSERIPNPMPGQPPLDTKTSDLAVPFYTGQAIVRRSSVFSLTDPVLTFGHPGQSSFTGQFDFGGP